jgi:hypothetical protein
MTPGVEMTSDDTTQALKTAFLEYKLAVEGAIEALSAEVGEKSPNLLSHSGSLQDQSGRPIGRKRKPRVSLSPSQVADEYEKSRAKKSADDESFSTTEAVEGFDRFTARIQAERAARPQVKSAEQIIDERLAPLRRNEQKEAAIIAAVQNDVMAEAVPLGSSYQTWVLDRNANDINRKLRKI